MAEGPFVPSGFVVPRTLSAERFRLEPLGPEHNDSDYEAWSSSVEHIRATPGWEASSWPDDRSLADNLRDLQAHADDFEQRERVVNAYVAGCIDLENVAVLNQRDAIASHRFVHVWRRYDDRQTGVAKNAELIPELAA